MTATDPLGDVAAEIAALFAYFEHPLAPSTGPIMATSSCRSINLDPKTQTLVDGELLIGFPAGEKGSL